MQAASSTACYASSNSSLQMSLQFCKRRSPLLCLTDDAVCYGCQALLPHVDALAAFLGRRECVDFLMPAIVTFLNDRSGWQLRAALFAHIGSIAAEVRVLCRCA